MGEAASYLDADPGELALTDSTTMGLGVVYGGMRFAAGDEIVTTEHDFFATHEALRLRAVQTGARIERVGLYRDPATATVDAMVSRLIDAVTPRTRLMAVTWTHSGTGVKLPIADIGAALADVNRDREKAERALLCVDGVHAFGRRDGDTRRARLRRADLGHAQVALRPARHRPRVDQPRRTGSRRPGDPALRG
ncbi:MAG: aminotransferase class V-fold PLP-dependent enzyme [Ilumatobacteraceae bacterium]